MLSYNIYVTIKISKPALGDACRICVSRLETSGIMKLHRRVYRLDDGKAVVYPGCLGPFFSAAPFGLEPLRDRPRSFPCGRAYVATQADAEVTDEALKAAIEQWGETTRYVHVFLLCQDVTFSVFEQQLRTKELSLFGRDSMIGVLTPAEIDDREVVEYVIRTIAELGYMPTLLTSETGDDVAVLVRPKQ